MQIVAGNFGGISHENSALFGLVILMTPAFVATKYSTESFLLTLRRLEFWKKKH